MDKYKILTWNIRQGGKKAINDIVESLLAHNPDTIVLTEYKQNESGLFLIEALKRAGWKHVQSSEPPVKENGVLIMSVNPLKAHGAPFSEQEGAHRWNEVYIPSLDLHLLGVHVPNVNETYGKRFFWDHITKYAHQRSNERVIIAGDFNTARRDEKDSAPLQYSEFITWLVENGWVDAWKHLNNDKLESSWYSHRGNGFRLDYLFLSSKIASRLTTCSFSHYERDNNYSDHSVLMVELELG